MGDLGPRPLDLVGRDEAMSAAVAGILRGGGVLVVGAPGVGKTALLGAVLELQAARPHTRVLRLVAGASGPSIPFGAFAPHVPDVHRMTGVRPDPFYLLQAVRRSIVAATDGERLVIGVDDAHRLDEPSATLLFQLVSAGDAVAVVSARTGEAVPDPIRSMWKEGLVERVDLGPLGAADVRKLGEAMLGGPLDGDLAEALTSASDGNPLYASELVIAGREAGRIVERHGVWSLEGTLPIGPRLEELLDERLSGVPSELSASLEAVAFADPLPVTVMRTVIPAEHADALQRLGLVRVGETGEGERVARPGHPLYGELIRSRITSARETELSLTLAEAFESDGRLRSELLRIVAWRLDSGAPPSADTLLEASLRAAERLDWRLSARLASAALGAGAPPGAAFALAEALGQLGRFEEALDALEGHEWSSDAERARVAVLRSSVLFWGVRRFDQAAAALEAAEERIDAPAERAWVTAVRAGMLAALGRPSDAVEVARSILDDGAEGQAADAARSALAAGLVWSGRTEEGLDVARAALERRLSRSGGVPLDSRWPAMVTLAGHRLAGRVADMEEFAGEEYHLAIRLHNGQAKAAAAAGLGWAALMRGQLTLASTRLWEALAALEGHDASAGRGQALVTLVEAVALTGDSLATTAVAAGARDEMVGMPEWASPRLHWCNAWVAASRGELSLATEELEAAAGEAALTGQTSFELIALGALNRLGVPGATPRLAELETWVEGELVKIVAEHARALATGSGEDLEGVSDRFEQMGLSLYAAEASAQASRAHTLAGQPRRATAAAVRTQVLLAGCDPERPLSVILASAPASLTRREREVALLARSGLPSQEIAERLHLSVRTVDTHLARVYYKLGITRRSELGTALDGDAETASTGLPS